MEIFFRKNRFLKNVLVLLFSQGIVKIVGIIYKLYLTNKLGYGDTGNRSSHHGQRRSSLIRLSAWSRSAARP